MMSFRFRVTDTWELPTSGVFHLIGLLEEGTVLPESEATVVGLSSRTVSVKSVSIVNQPEGKLHPNEFTLSIEGPEFDIRTLRGKTLIGQRKESAS